MPVSNRDLSMDKARSLLAELTTIDKGGYGYDDLGPRGKWDIGRYIDKYNESSDFDSKVDALGEIGKKTHDVLKETYTTHYGDWRDKLELRGQGYGIGIGTGAILGMLLGGDSFGDRLINGLLGGGVGAFANWLRRRTYYGKHIDW